MGFLTNVFSSTPEFEVGDEIKLNQKFSDFVYKVVNDYNQRRSNGIINNFIKTLEELRSESAIVLDKTGKGKDATYIIIFKKTDPGSLIYGCEGIIIRLSNQKLEHNVYDNSKLDVDPMVNCTDIDRKRKPFLYNRCFNSYYESTDSIYKFNDIPEAISDTNNYEKTIPKKYTISRNGKEYIASNEKTMEQYKGNIEDTCSNIDYEQPQPMQEQSQHMQEQSQPMQEQSQPMQEQSQPMQEQPQQIQPPQPIQQPQGGKSRRKSKKQKKSKKQQKSKKQKKSKKKQRNKKQKKQRSTRKQYK